jgi:hypothetical protein
VTALILGGVLLLAANLYVQSATVQHRIRAALGESLKMPVAMRKTTFTPWDGLRIDGIVAAPDPENAARPTFTPFLTADSFRIRFALGPLLKRRFEVSEVLLDHPHLSWPQDAKGQWRFPPESLASAPEREKFPPREQPPAATGTPVASPAPEPAITVTPASAPAEAAPSPPRFEVALDHIRLRHAEIDFLDTSGTVLYRFEEVNADGRIKDADQANGTFWFDKATWAGSNAALTKFNGRFACLPDGSVDLTDGHGELAEGAVSLEYHLHNDQPGSPYSVTGEVDRVSLPRLFEEIGAGAQPLTGHLKGDFSVNPQVASGHIQLLDNEVKSFPLLETFGEALRIDDLKHLQFKQAAADWKLEGQTLQIDPLMLVSNDFQIAAHGTYALDRDHLNIHARFQIDQAISHQLPQFIESNFTLCGDEAPNSRYLDFTVTGPLAKPNTNLFERALSGPLNGLVENLMAPKPKSSKKGGKHPGASPSPAASPTPSSTP